MQLLIALYGTLQHSHGISNQHSLHVGLHTMEQSRMLQLVLGQAHLKSSCILREWVGNLVAEAVMVKRDLCASAFSEASCKYKSHDVLSAVTPASRWLFKLASLASESGQVV